MSNDDEPVQGELNLVPKPTPRKLVVLRKTNDTPIKNGDVVYDRAGKRYYVLSITWAGMRCVSMCPNKYHSSGTHHDFGCYLEGTSRKEASHTIGGNSKQKLRDYWEADR